MTETLREAFLRISLELQRRGGPVDITEVLDALPAEHARGEDAAVIAAIDAIMDDLYQERRLTCPGHKWLSEPLPSIEGHLVRLFELGHVRRDRSGRWERRELTSYFVSCEQR
ncbi:MAG: hypothetical protein IT378_04655 [Sandaracinaceae bacterium]|nr:hypothetical protein [Sandaracinaceae bacterium]